MSILIVHKTIILKTTLIINKHWYCRPLTDPLALAAPLKFIRGPLVNKSIVGLNLSLTRWTLLLAGFARAYHRGGQPFTYHAPRF